jgi:hypothetical protein
MRSLLIVVCSITILGFAMGCKSGSSSADKTFCDTSCLRDSIKFTGDHKLNPFVYISARDCKADTLKWGYKGMSVFKQAAISDLLGNSVRINPGYLKCYIRDTSYIWLLLNNCVSGRGFVVKLNFNNAGGMVNGKAINSTDPAFKVADNLVAWTDGGNIFVEDAMTGKTAQMTFGVDLHIDDYSAIHDYIESVDITPDHIWAKVKIDKEWVVKEKDITLK